MVFHRCADFDVLEEIHLWTKSQPESNKQDGFEEENEPTLEHIPGNIVIIIDR